MTTFSLLLSFKPIGSLPSLRPSSILFWITDFLLYSFFRRNGSAGVPHPPQKIQVKARETASFLLWKRYGFCCYVNAHAVIWHLDRMVHRKLSVLGNFLKRTPKQSKWRYKESFYRSHWKYQVPAASGVNFSHQK